MSKTTVMFTHGSTTERACQLNISNYSKVTAVHGILASVTEALLVLLLFHSHRKHTA